MELVRQRKKKTIGYREIAGILVDEIKGGKWSVDDRLPTEMELVARFGVGRNTVREALRELESLSYIERRRGTRSILKTVNSEHAFVNSVRSVEELLEYAKTTKATLLMSEIVRADERLSERLDCPVDSEWARVGVLRSRDDSEPPFCYSEIYLDPRYRDVVSHIGANAQLYPMLEKYYGVVLSRVVQEIEAAAADPNIASRLNIPIGTAILLVRTKFFSDDGQLVEIGLAHFPCGRYRVRIALDRKGASL